MDEAGGCCGLIVVVLAIVLAVAAWRELRREPAPAPAPAAVGDQAVAADDPDGRGLGGLIARSPIGPRGVLVVLGLLYGIGLFLIRPTAIRAKRSGSSDQQAALSALTVFAFSPIVVPALGAWRALGVLGQALTSSPDDDGKPPRKPRRGRDDLE